MFPLTSNQKAIWFEQKLFPHTPIYNASVCTRIHGNIDRTLFEKAVNLLIAQSDALRSRFFEVDGTPRVQFHPFDPSHPYHLPYLDFSAAKDSEARCLAWAREQATLPLPFLDNGLYSFALLKISDTEYGWYIQMHHTIADAWSVSLMIDRVSSIYTSLVKGEKVASDTLFPYADYIREDLDYLHSPAFARDEAYWKDKFADIPKPITVGVRDGKKDADLIKSTRKIVFLDKRFTGKIQAFATQKGVTPYIVFLGVLYTYFSRVNQATDLVIGTPILNRSAPSSKKTIGLFVGILPLRINYPSAITFGELVAGIKHTFREEVRHQQYPIDEIIRMVKAKAPDLTSLFNIVLSFEKQNFNIPFNGYPTEVIVLPHYAERTPLAVFVRETHSGEVLEVDFDFNLGHWDTVYMEQFLEQFPFLFEALIDQPDQAIAGLPIVTERTKALLLAPPALSPTEPGTLVEHFEAAVKAWPGHTALEFDNKRLTYAELNAQSNALAHYLRNTFNVQPEQVVAFSIPRSEKAIIAILGILKSGAAYLPIDPAYPEARRRYMLDNSDARLLLTEGDIEAAISNGDTTDPVFVNTPAHACYIIYTSGSTGKPKGVVVEHRGVVNTVAEYIKAFRITPSENCLQFASLSFDASALEIFMALFSGAALFPVSADTIGDPDRFSAFLHDKKIDALYLPPSYTRNLDKTALSGIRILISGGDAAVPRSELHFRDDQEYYNGYGPTECSVCAAIYKETSDLHSNVPIGRPISNMQAFILDDNLQLLPPGVPGEIFLSGLGLARGYINNPALTAEKFIPSPFEQGKLLYRTGDEGRWLSDGNMEYLGRKDDQVKIRGYRVEPGEIEVTLTHHPSIQNAAVIVKGSGLYAFVVTGADITTDALFAFLKNSLPHYMIPDRLFIVANIPVTISGKVDKEALLTNIALGSTTNTYIRPATENEELVAKIWQELLDIAQIGATDNFFQLGGHSLKVGQFINRVYKQTGIKLAFSDIFHAAVLRNVAALIDTGRHSASLDFLRIPGSDRYPLSPSQKGIWLASQLKGQETLYNVPLVFVMWGPVSFDALKAAFAVLIDRHESLRTSFVETGGLTYQQIMPGISPEIETIHIEEEDKQDTSVTAILSAHLQTHFNLAEAPLFRISFVSLHAEKTLILFTLHHLIADGWSVQLLLDELIESYLSLVPGNASTHDTPFPLHTPLPHDTPFPTPDIPPFQYKDYSDWLAKMIESQEGEKQKKYWLGKLQPARPFSLAHHTGRTLDPKKTGALHSFRYPPEINQGIRQLAERSGSTVFMVLQALVKVLLYKLTGQHDIIIGTAVSGREKEEMEKIAGLFINTIALYDQVQERDPFAAFLQQVKLTTLEGLENQLLPFDQVIESIQPESNALFDVMISVDDQKLTSGSDIFITEDPVIDLLKAIYNEAKFNIIFDFDTKEADLELQVIYDTSVFTREYIILIGRYLSNLATQVIANPAKNIDNYLLYHGNEPELFNYLSISGSQFESVYPLTTTQRDIYLTSVLDPEGGGLRLLVYFEISGSIDAGRWAAAIQKVTGEEDSLRSALIIKDTEVFQGVKKDAKINFLFIDISAKDVGAIAINAKDKSAIHASAIHISGEKPVDPVIDQLIKTHCRSNQDLNKEYFTHYLFKVSDHRYIGAASAHHIFIDGVSFQLLVEKIDRTYHEQPDRTSLAHPDHTAHFLAPGSHHSERLQSSPARYRNYVFTHLSRFDTASTEQFWRERLSATQPLSYAGALTTQDNVICDSLHISGDEALQIKDYCREHRLKPALFFKAVYALLTKYYCNADHDFCIRENVAGRSRRQLDLLGCISHCFPLLIEDSYLKEAGSLADLCDHLQQQKTSAKEFRYISLSLQNRIIGEERLSFFYNYQYFNLPKTQIEIGILEQVYQLMNNQLELRIVEMEDAFGLKLDYNERIFNGRQFLARIRHIVTQVVQEDPRLPDLRYLTGEELSQLNTFGNSAATIAPIGVSTVSPIGVPIAPIAEKNILELFEEQVDRNPHNIAVIFRNKELTYADLDRRSDAVAAHLQKLGVANEDIVGIMTDRSEWMIVALLGVLKAGAAYLPIDPAYPKERIEYLLRDSGAAIVLTHTELPAQASALAIAGPLVVTGSPTQAGPLAITEPSTHATPLATAIPIEDIPANPNPPTKRKIAPNQLAYVIYTSGTTGHPKGVMIEHHSLSNIARAWREAYHLDSFDISLLQMASFSFDVFTGDMVRALTNGGKMVICPSDARLEPASLYELIDKHKVNVFESTPALLVPLMEYIHEQQKDTSFLRLLLLGSDVCPVAHFRQLLERFAPAIRIINTYGVTETCIDSGFYEASLDILPASGITPVGKPLDNYTYHVCNATGQLVPVGVPGELWIGGEGVARGYIGRQGLTAEKFIRNPFINPNYEKHPSASRTHENHTPESPIHRSHTSGSHNPGRLYKTGDIVRWLPDGSLEFSGRKDNQVKVRGYRIELPEIESALLRQQEIKEAIVTVHESHNEKELIGWYVSRTGVPITGLKDDLRQHLPEYMVPAHFILLDKLPLTPNGKVDRKALPDPMAYIDNRSIVTDLPTTGTEAVLLTVWQDVLKRKSIGIYDNFFELGGHSLKATNAVARIFKTLQVNLPLNIFFNSPSIKEQGAYIDKQQKGLADTIQPAPARAFYPLSSSQKRLYLLHQIEGSENSYNMPGAFWVKGDIDIQHLEKCFSSLIARHEMLRTSFEMRDGEPVQIIKESVPFRISRAGSIPLDLVDSNSIPPYPEHTAPTLSGIGHTASIPPGISHTELIPPGISHTGSSPLPSAYPAALSSELDTLIRSFIQTFDLSAPPLLRAQLCYIPEEPGTATTGQTRKLLLLDMHHIISDGVSVDILLRELIRLYNGENLEPLSLQYKDFAVWQNNFLASDTIKEQEKYWLAQFSEAVPMLNVQTDFPRPAQKTFNGRRKHLQLPDNICLTLDNFSNLYGYTINQLLLTAFNILLYKYSGNEDIVVGTPVAGRTRAELDSVLGMFVNTLALRSYPSGKKTVKDFLSEVRQTSIEALKHQDYPFEMLIDRLDAKRDLSRNPLFDIMFAFLHEDSADIPLGDAVLESINDIYDTSKFDLLFQGAKRSNGIELSLEYSTDLFTEDFAASFLDHYVNLLQEITLDHNRSLAAIDILTPVEEKSILFDGNHSSANYPADKCLHHLFEEQAAKFPSKAALVWYDQEATPRTAQPTTHQTAQALTYADLNARSHQVAASIRTVLPDAKNPIIAVLLDRTPEMIIALLGILKAGGAYLPIDPAYPADRIRYMLDDSRAGLLIAHSDAISPNGESPLDYTGKIILIDRLTTTAAYTPVTVQPGDLAYIIYTSGSTGQPKGVMIEHRNVVRLLFNDKSLFDFTENDTWTLFHSYCFDFSVWEMYGALLFGGKLVIIPRATAQSPKEFLKVLKDQKVTVLNQTPGSFYNIMAEEMDDPESALAIRYFIFGGEALKPGKLKAWKEKYPLCKLINMYGITETTVHVTYKEITQREIESNTSNIGRPIPTLSLLILDRDLKIVPPGVAGELHVGGAGLARGYLGRPELTAQRFIDHPYIPGEKLYRTGDLAKMLTSGDFEYLGRIDHQVKIRGYRIEPGEIESKLLLHREVKDALVIHIEGKSDAGSGYLCAYVVTNHTLPLTASDLRNHLSDSLPDYMIPSFFVILESFPLTANGKIDRKRLPLPEGSNLSAATYEAPVTPIEKELAALWTKLLNVPKAGLNDHFFEIGGHSLKAAQLAALIHKHFHVELSIKSIFTAPRLRDLAALIDKADHSLHHSIERAPLLSRYPASSAEKRLFILNQIDNSGISYNIPGFYAIEGDIDVNKFRQAVLTVIHRHDILRSAFTIEDREVIQIVQDIPDFEVEVIDSDFDIDAVTRIPGIDATNGISDIGLANGEANPLRDFIRPFDLSKAPLLRISLVRTPSGQYIFAFDIHHIIADGVSVDNFIKELSAIYSGARLPQLSIQSKDFAVWQKKWLRSEEALSQKAFWTAQFEEEAQLLNMPVDFVRPLVKSYEGGVFQFTIPGRIADAIKEVCQSGGATPFMVMLAAYTILLSKYSGQEDIIVGTPVAGRSHTDLQDLIGMFVNTIPLRQFPAAEETFMDFLQKVKEGSLKAFENQQYPFEELLDDLEIKRDMGRNPIFDYMFTYRFDNKQEIRISNLVLKNVPIQHNISKMDISLEVIEDRDGEGRSELSVTVEYATRLFTPQTIERLSGHFTRILEQIIADPYTKLKDIELVTEKERSQILRQFNSITDPSKSIDSDKTVTAGPIAQTPKHIADLFEENALRFPDNIAVATDKDTLTYKALNKKASLLADILIAKGCAEDSIVGLYIDRSIDLIIGMLAILKAGAAYLPMDPEYPQERIRYMLEDSDAVLVLTQKKFAATLSFVHNKLFVDDPLHQDNGLTHDTPPATNPVRSPNHLAYVIYTSGSTGKPKGVQIEHGSLYNFLLANALLYNNTFGPDDVCLSHSSISFDASVLEIFIPLTAGATLVIISKENVYDVQALANVLVNKKITFAYIPPSLLQPLYNVLKNCPALYLNKLDVGAEPVKEKDLRNYAALNKDMQIVNSYGPTEATIVSARYPYKPGLSEGTNVPIGKPIHNARIYIVNEYMKIQPIGVPGELCIAGAGLARGYLNNPELTKQKFIDNPFEPGHKLYKTGDLAKWLPDGNIEFIGRKDHQVKIRGFRIELGEIESRLLTHPAIRQVLVVDKTDKSGNKFLCAYILSTAELLPSDLRAYVAATLPRYMIPSFFVMLDQFPLTKSEKIDRRRLPEPDMEKKHLVAGLVLPADPTEKKLLDIWRTVLELENISVTDNFFEIGGNSLKIINMLRLIQGSVSEMVKVNDLFDKPTIREQAAAISKTFAHEQTKKPKKAKRLEF